MKVIEKIDSEGVASKIKEAADLCAETIASGKLVHMFGSGHSILPVLDVFPRYGGYVGWHPLMDPRLMWHNVIGPNDAPRPAVAGTAEGLHCQLPGQLRLYGRRSNDCLLPWRHERSPH